MAADLSLRLMTDADAPSASRLAIEAFDAAIAPLYSDEGVRAFHAYASPDALAARSGDGNFALLAFDCEALLGMAEVRDHAHLAMLFVSPGVQRSGVGRRLLARAIELCLESKPDLAAISVNASPNSVGAYERLGFVAVGEERTENGIRSTPMVYRLGA
jgi:GNAT superfamily N-acetyltransferase